MSDTTMTPPRLPYTVKELADAVGMSPAYIRQLIRSGKLPRVGDTGRKVLVPRSAVEEWLANSR